VKALVLAAGLGTRLRPLTNSVPKCMVPIHGRPLLDYWLELLLAHGIERVLINTHYLPGTVREFVSRSTWRDRVDLVHEDELLGTGGTILRNRDYLEDDAFLVAHGDNLTRFDVAAFLARHRTRPPEVEITMMTFKTDTPQSCGIVEEDRRSVVTQFWEKVAKPPGDHANGAVYIFEPSVIGFLAALNKQFIDISTEVLPHYLGRIVTFHNEDYHRDIGTLESLRRAEAEFGNAARKF
jgi:mannose-1-phosphate guanylyltransferase